MTNNKTPDVDTSKNLVSGTVDLEAEVIAKIAAMAIRNVEGLHSLGSSRLLPFRDGTIRGIAAEVGKEQAALDLDVIIEYGHEMAKVASEVRQVIASTVLKMAGKEVVEVNIHVVGVDLPEEESKKDEPRVR